MRRTSPSLLGCHDTLQILFYLLDVLRTTWCGHKCKEKFSSSVKIKGSSNVEIRLCVAALSVKIEDNEDIRDRLSLFKSSILG